MRSSTSHKRTFGWLLNCEEVTYLISLSEHEPIGVKQKMALRFHYLVCKVCLYYARQSKQINDLLIAVFQSQKMVMNEAKKERIQRMLENEIKQ
jgi:hypothetical protein